MVGVDHKSERSVSAERPSQGSHNAGFRTQRRPAIGGLVGPMALWGQGLFAQDQGVIATKRMVYRALAAVVSVALLLAGCSVFEDDRLGSGPHMFFPEATAIFYVAVQDEALDANVLWNELHDDIRAETSRSAFVDCVYARADRTGPASTLPESDEYEPDILNVAMHGGEVPSTNVLVRGENTYSIADRRDDRGIIAFDVQVEGPQDTSVTTVLLSPAVDDRHWDDPRYSPPGHRGGVVVGTAPEDHCLDGAESVRERLQRTGMISVEGLQGERPELVDYRVLAVVWDGAPDDGNLVGGAFWWTADEGKGRDGVHPPNEGDADAVGEVPSDDEEPRRAPDWVNRAFLPTETVRIEPGTYSIEVWANPIELTPSATSGVAAEGAERNCVIEVEVTAGTHQDVFIEDMPTGGGECPHETKFRESSAGPGI